MSHEAPTPNPRHEEPVGAQVHQLTEQIPQLVRSEMRLAQAELTEKGKRAGIGLGAFSAAGLLAFFGVAATLTAAIAALALVLPVWASSLVVAAALFAIAGLAGALGRRKLGAATPAKPERALHGVRDDLAAMKGERR